MRIRLLTKHVVLAPGHDRARPLQGGSCASKSPGTGYVCERANQVWQIPCIPDPADLCILYFGHLGDVLAQLPPGEVWLDRDRGGTHTMLDSFGDS